jgi:hypothetical protein
LTQSTIALAKADASAISPLRQLLIHQCLQLFRRLRLTPGLLLVLESRHESKSNRETGASQSGTSTNQTLARQSHGAIFAKVLDGRKHAIRRLMVHIFYFAFPLLPLHSPDEIWPA